MPAVDTVLLPLCVGLALLGVIATGVAWRRGNKGRVVQGVALALAPIALYFSGLLRLLWNGIVAVGTWASTLIFSLAIWFGMALLGLCLVLWVVGGFIARRSRPQAKAVSTQSSAAALPAKNRGARNQPPVDEDMAEIEALLKSRGIE
jgi:Na+/H+-dicarboxylate symporter